MRLLGCVGNLNLNLPKEGSDLAEPRRQPCGEKIKVMVDLILRRIFIWAQTILNDTTL